MKIIMVLCTKVKESFPDSPSCAVAEGSKKGTYLDFMLCGPNDMLGLSGEECLFLEDTGTQPGPFWPVLPYLRC
jgi:hypothetical protein